MADLTAPLRYVNGADTITVIDPTATAISGDFIDVATEHGTDTGSINAAIDAANANWLAGEGPTVVYLKAGDWASTGVITMKSGVTLAGAGRYATRIVKTGDGPGIEGGNGTSVFTNTPDPSWWLEDATIQDLWIDCAGQGTGSVGWAWPKGINITYARRCLFQRLGISDSWRTAFGLDYPVDHTIVDDCIVMNPRDQGVDKGGNGIGVMSGVLATEDFICTNVTAIGCRSGVVVEVWKNMTNNGRGARVDNCMSIDCQYGFENAGVPAATFDSCVAIGSWGAGFKFGEGDHGGDDLTTGLATMDNCFSINGAKGVSAYFDTPAVARHASLVIQNSVIDNSTGAGIVVTAAEFDVNNLTIRNNTITNNAGGGIRLGSSGAGEFVDVSIHGNDLHGNTGSAIRLNTDTLRGRIEGNNVVGGASTKGVELVTGKTATGLVVNGGRLSTSTPVDIAGTLTDCHVGFVPGWTRGAGAPTVKAPLGAVYQRTDGTAGTLLYVNTDGGTTWSAYA